jgi:hypothetical protein
MTYRLYSKIHGPEINDNNRDIIINMKDLHAYEEKALNILRELNVGQDHWIKIRINPGYDGIHCYVFINRTSRKRFSMAFGDPNDSQFKEMIELHKMMDYAI